VEMAAEYFLQLENFSPSQIFENKLQAALSGSPMEAAKDGALASVARPFLDAVAAPTATPGGGSVSAFAAALAGALGLMVAGLSRKKKSQAAHVDKLSEHLEALRKSTEELARAIDRDAESYDQVMKAFKLPQGNAEESRQREKALQRTTRGATEVPLDVAKRSIALLESLVQLETIAAASMKSDLQVARFVASAGARGAIANVEINLDAITDAGYVQSVREQVAALRKRIETF
jgi:formiminotetrahydrofolate cyclodeaminase